MMNIYARADANAQGLEDEKAPTGYGRTGAGYTAQLFGYAQSEHPGYKAGQ